VSEPLGEQARRRLLELAAADDDARDDTANTSALPSLPPRYEVVRELGRGGMGVVYEVKDHQLGRRVALKTLAASTAPELRVRLQREALAVARLRHPHIAAVFDATPEFLTMQLVDGGPIAVLAPTADAAARRTVVAQVRDAARALQHAHEQGLVHRAPEAVQSAGRARPCVRRRLRPRQGDRRPAIDVAGG
jgi:eukaryotic-like serine/threonine-protein kinase